MTPKNKQQLPKLYVKRSSIHGKGLFSKTPIKKGELIGPFTGVPGYRDCNFTLWLTCKKDTKWKGLKVYENGTWWKCIRPTTITKFANHSYKPNAEFRRDKLVAIKNIKPNTEIAWHYGPDWEDPDIKRQRR